MTDFDESGNSIRIILLTFAENRTRNMEKDYRTADNLRQEKDMSVAEPQGTYITRSIEEAYRQWCGDNFSREAVYRRLNRLETQFAAGDFSGCITDSEAREMMGRTLPWLR